MKLVVGDILYVNPYINPEKYDITCEKYSDSPLTVTNVRNSKRYNGELDEEICIKWFDGSNWWWGQIGYFEPWTILFITEKQYLRDKKLIQLLG